MAPISQYARCFWRVTLVPERRHSNCNSVSLTFAITTASVFLGKAEPRSSLNFPAQPLGSHLHANDCPTSPAVRSLGDGIGLANCRSPELAVSLGCCVQAGKCPPWPPQSLDSPPPSPTQTASSPALSWVPMPTTDCTRRSSNAGNWRTARVWSVAAKFAVPCAGSRSTTFSAEISQVMTRTAYLTKPGITMP